MQQGQALRQVLMLVLLLCLGLGLGLLAVLLVLGQRAAA
jgi:hypothetical protein